MKHPFDKHIMIQKINNATEEWIDQWSVHAYVNKAKNDTEFLSAGAIQNRRTLVFEIRYFKALEQISLNAQAYRILFNGVPYNIEDYDDYLLKHKTVKLLGANY